MDNQKYNCAVEMAAIAENEVDRLKKQIEQCINNNHDLQKEIRFQDRKIDILLTFIRDELKMTASDKKIEKLEKDIYGQQRSC